MNPEPSFGQWLKKRRKALGLTQEELARRVPCAVITLQKIEAGVRRPSEQLAERLGEHLEIPADELPSFVRFARIKPGVRGLGLELVEHRLAPAGAWPRRMTNLPARPAPLIGRDQDVAAVRKSLLDDGVPLLTLVGPPGVGKTRLAIRVGVSALDDFDDGVYLVALAPVTEPDLVAATIAQTLGINETANHSFAERLKAYLRDKHMLLVLDNLEQVAPAGPLIAELLAECPWLTILVTSRAPLRIRRERRFVVRPLAWPLEEDAGWDEWARFSALALFVDRAQAVRPDFRVTPGNARAIAAICAHLDGLPLAIELVAARAAVLSPHALLERLGARLILHTDGLGDLSERHRTLHHAIDWSYALLSPGEQLLLARTAVFVGGWTLDAAEEVAWDTGSQSALTVLDALTSLVTGSLVVQLEHGGEPRFTLLETIRTFAFERLAERGEDAIMRQRHAEYYLALAEKADGHLRSAEQQVWLDRLETERANLRTALAWFIDAAGDVEAGLRLAGALGRFWTMRSHVSEGRSWSARALEAGSSARPALRAKVLVWAGMLSWPGDLAVASSLVGEGILLLRKEGPSQWWELACALTGWALLKAYEGDCGSVQSAGEEALALFQQLQDAWGVALALAVLGEAHLLRHDNSGACSRFQESLALFRRVGDKWGAGMSLLNWGYTESLQGNLDAARDRLEESIAMHREVGERATRSLTLNILGQVMQQQGYSQRAAALYAESLDLLRKMGLEASAADVLYNLAYLAQCQGHNPLAERLYTECLAMFAKQGNTEGMARCSTGLAAVSGTLTEAG